VSVSDPIEAPPRATKTKLVATVVVLIAFFGGAVIGALCDRAWIMHHRGGPPRFAIKFITSRVLEKLDRELKLTPQQRAQVKQTIDVHAVRIQTIWEGVQPQIAREIDRNNEEIERVLTPEQRTKFKRLKMQFVQRHIRHR